MLAMAAARFGFEVVVLDPDPLAPAAQVATSHVVAAYDDASALAELADRCDAVTYEFENVPAATTEVLAGLGARLAPNPEALAISQERLREKDFLRSAGLDTAPYRAIDGPDDVVRAVEELGGRAIVKTRRLGYDGKGQRRIDGDASPALFADMGSVPLLAEGFVDFVCEISVIVARAADGSVVCFPPARNEHRDGILARSTVPCGLSEEVTAAAIDAASRLIEALDYVGVLGLELFVLADDRLVANEFAPRVHNSGHWTELASVTDQFEQHVRAVAGLPLGSTESFACEMENLIGHDVDRFGQLLADAEWRVHLYGKTETREGRKMGHATRLR